MNKHLVVLLACLFAVMIGFGITMPVLPFYTERLALAKGASREAIAIHVSLLTSVYALMGCYLRRCGGSGRIRSDAGVWC